VLQKLEERGAVARIESSAGVRYAPVPPLELTRRLGDRFQGTLAAAQGSLQELAQPAEYEYIWNAHGYAVLIEHARALIDVAHARLLVAIRPPEALTLAVHMAQAEARGVEVTTLCMEGCPSECGGCRGHIYRYRVAPEQHERWLVLVPDDAEVLAGEIGAGEDTQAVRTRQRLLVDLASWYVYHSIALAAMVSDLGDRLDHLLGPEARAALKTVGRAEQHGGWLAHMRQILNRQG
jgi:hypothetical protein